jgi:hypothetical protein
LKLRARSRPCGATFVRGQCPPAAPSRTAAPWKSPWAEGTAYDNISFRPVTSFVGAAPQYGDTIRFSLLPERGEVVDGVDNDRDGIVDERMLVRTIGGVGTATLSGVTAFSVTRNGENLTVSMQITVRNQLSLIVRMRVSQLR